MRHVNKVLAALAIVVVLPVLYAGSYLAMVNTSDSHFAGGDSGEPSKLVFEPGYRFGGRVAAVFFYPAHVLDRLLRPNEWEWEGSFSR